MHSSRDVMGQAREAYLIDRGQTLEPKGINKREEMSFVYIYCASVYLSCNPKLIILVVI